jgi:hypothetical protein
MEQMKQRPTPVQASHSSSQDGTVSLHPREDLVDYVSQYAREKPEVIALWCFGVGFILGWKLKPW